MKRYAKTLSFNIMQFSPGNYNESWQISLKVDIYKIHEKYRHHQSSLVAVARYISLIYQCKVHYQYLSQKPIL